MSPAVKWIGMPVLLLAINAIAVGVLIVKSGDPSDRVVPDYYRRALEQDATLAALRASDELGWQAEARLASIGVGVDRVEVVLADGAGRPIDRAHVSVEVRHRSRATGAAAVLIERAPGRYTAEVDAQGSGLHVVDVKARRGAEHYAASRTIAAESPP